jgi:acyl carrier protein
MHAAGVAQQFNPVSETTVDELAEVISGKVGGAANLHELLGDTELDAFVLFSSNAALWGSGGNGAYAAGNAYLDVLAAQRRALGLTATSVAWGAWADTQQSVTDYMQRRGVGGMAPDLALAALAQAVEQDETFIAVADIDWDRFVVGFTSGRPSPLLDEVTQAHRAATEAERRDDGTAAQSVLMRRMAGLPEQEQTDLLLGIVGAEVAAVLRHSPADRIPADRAFKNLGFDSLTAVELRDRLAAATGLRLPASLVFDHPTPLALAKQLRTELVPGLAPVLAGLDALENAILALAGDGAAAGKLADRLASLARQVRGGDESRHLDDDLESASAEEMFDLIDRQLGS